MISEDTDRFGWLVRLSFGAVMKGVNDPHSKQPHSHSASAHGVFAIL